MARRRSNRLPPHEPTIIVDPRVYDDAAIALAHEPPEVAPDFGDDDARLSEPPPVSALGGIVRAAALVALSACASFVGVRFVRTHLSGTAHAALVATPLAPAYAPADAVALPAAPAPVVLPLPPPLAPEPAWMAKLHAARAKHAAGRLDDAEALFREVLARRAEVPAALLGLARVRLARGDCAEASMLAARVLVRLPKNRGASDVLAACLRVDAGARREPESGANKIAVVREPALPPNPF